MQLMHFNERPQLWLNEGGYGGYSYNDGNINDGVG